MVGRRGCRSDDWKEKVSRAMAAERKWAHLWQILKYKDASAESRTVAKLQAEEHFWVSVGRIFRDVAAQQLNHHLNSKTFEGRYRPSPMRKLLFYFSFIRLIFSYYCLIYCPFTENTTRFNTKKSTAWSLRVK